MTTCALRLKAAEVIEERGWCQRAFQQRDGSVCLIGALSVVLTGAATADSAALKPYRDTVASLGFMTDIGGFMSAVAWNDAPERTKEEVLARLREGCVEAAR